MEQDASFQKIMELFLQILGGKIDAHIREILKSELRIHEEKILEKVKIMLKTNNLEKEETDY